MKNTKLEKKLLEIFNILSKAYGPQKCNLDHSTPLQLLVSTILSAQCTDARVNIVTKTLFKKYPDAKAFASAKLEDLEQDVKSCGYYHAKSKNIIAACKMVMEDFDGVLPDEMDELVKLPGVGRKTANVVLGDAFGKPGFPVDTHVLRLVQRIGLCKCDDPVKIEFQIAESFPAEKLADLSHLLISHGRKRCPARKPDCEHCEIKELCPKLLKASK